LGAPITINVFSSFHSDEKKKGGTYKLQQLGYDPPQGDTTPEEKLILTNLIQAILSYLDVGSKYSQEDKTWIFSRHKQERIFSFTWCCDALGINPNKLRQRLKDEFPTHRAKGVKISCIVFDYQNGTEKICKGHRWTKKTTN
jgi:hypothetical protein